MTMNNFIYFDNAATTFIDQDALKDYNEISINKFGNPSASYSFGYNSKRIITKARNEIAKLINCEARDIIFTSGGTESNNLLIQGLVNKYEGKAHIITTTIEHKSILNILKNNNEIEYTLINVDNNGNVNPIDIKNAIKSNTICISIQMVNNELGITQNIKEISKIAKEYGIFFHSDAVQAVGHIDIDVKELGLDALSASGHKFGSPKGIGFLYTKNHDICLNYGGGQEFNQRSGTENVPAIKAMETALKNSLIDLNNKQMHITNMINYLEYEFSNMNGVKLNIFNSNYHTIINVCFKGINNEAFMNQLDMQGVCVSVGSACDGNNTSRSHVLKSIGLSNDEIDSSIRISLSYLNTMDECEKTIKIIKNILKRFIH